MLTKERGDFRFLAIFLALATALTVFVISACYSHIMEEFPSGGGGYLVASKLLGPQSAWSPAAPAGRLCADDHRLDRGRRRRSVRPAAARLAPRHYARFR